ncbi:MAG: 4-alpha-glucanotransferase [candidate division KSB1 bacterium]|nr:4-alpha-glucanotransferase [candidate division KSB1 bacterium]
MDKRGSGLLLHISSLPSPYGIGDFGPRAFEFADFIKKSKQRFWQILPLNPTNAGTDYSPYLSQSAFAMNPLLLSPDMLQRDGLLLERECAKRPEFPETKIEFDKIVSFKKSLFRKAFDRFKKRTDFEEFRGYCEVNGYWLNDYALFVSLKTYFDEKSWVEWPAPYRDRDPETLKNAKNDLSDDIYFEKFLQYQLYKQWMGLKHYCNESKIKFVGDLPIYVAHDSADVWANTDKFKLKENRYPQFVAGVPPDYFSETGQLWGTPVYNWDTMSHDGYSWWHSRMGHNLHLFDIVRIDHFRGFVAYWQVDASEDTAINGEWIQAPARDFFRQLRNRFPDLPIIAEDLGLITPDVIDVMHEFELPGMKVIMFAFSKDIEHNPHIPFNLRKNSFFYTGTHDNNTLQGWYYHEIDEQERERVNRYLGKKPKRTELHWTFIRCAMQSVANTVVFPVQDILGLGGEHRMNNPSKRSGNWRWRMPGGHLDDELAETLADMVEIYGRTGQ